jgi:hypothetical protein
MRNEMRMGFAVLVSAVALVGCSCEPTTPAVQCPDIRVKFVTPEAGASVSAPFTASIEATDSDNAFVTFDSAKLTIAGQSFDGTMGEGQKTATFSGLTAAAGPQTMVASITRQACSADAVDPANRIPTASRTVTVVAGCSPKVTAVAFPQDTDTNGVLNSVEFAAGQPMKMLVTASPANCLGDVQVRIKNDVATPGALTSFTNGAATIDVQLADDGTYSLFAELVRGSSVLNTRTNNAEAVAAIKVVRAMPMCTNTTVLTNGPNTDQTRGNSTFDLLATGTAFAANGTSLTASFTIENGASSTPVAPATGTGEISWLTALPQATATYTLTLVAVDAFGNRCQDPKVISVDYSPLTVVITSPSGTGADGGYPLVTTTPFPLVATVTKNGQPFECLSADAGMGCAFGALRRAGSDAGFTGTSRNDVVDGGTTLRIAFASSGQFELLAGVVDTLGNQGQATVLVDAALTVCGVGFTSPASCPATVFRSNLNSNSDLAVTFASANCVGRAATLMVNGVSTATGPVASNGTFGPSAVHLTSSGPVTLRAEVENQVGDATFAECVLDVDLTAPAITSPVPAASATQVTLNSAQDGNSSTPGAQTTLTYNANVPSAGRADVCTTQAVNPVTMAPRAPCTDGASGWYLLASNVATPSPAFTFPEGSYSVKLVVVVDTSTNVSAAVAMVVDVTAPCVSAAGLTFDRDNGAGSPAFAGDGRLNVAEYAQSTPFLSFAPGCGDTTSTLASVNPVSVLQIVGNAAVSLPTGVSASLSSASGRFNANVTGLTGSLSYVFFVRLTDAVGNSNTYQGTMDPARRALSMALVAPTCSITSPSLSLLGKAQVPGGVLSATVATDAAAMGTVVSTDLIGPLPGTAVRNTSGTAVMGVATPSFTGLTGDDSWSLNARCTDTAGNATSAATRTVRVDLVDPTIAFQTPANNGRYQSLTIPTVLNVTGADGQSVQVVSSLQAAAVSTPAVVAGVATDALATYPLGAQAVTATVQDAAGNSGSAVVNIVANNVSCSLTPTNVFLAGGKAYINRSFAPGGVTNFTATSSCFGATVALSLLDSGGTPIVPAVATGSSSGAGVVAFIGQAVSDGQVYRVSIDNGTGLVASADYTVDTIAPTLVFNTPNATPGTYVVLGIPTNLSVSGAEGQSVQVTSTQPAPGGTAVTTVSVVAGVASDPNTSYPKGPQTVTATVSDVAGNPGTASIAIVVNSTACTLAPTNVVQAGGNSYINAAAAPGGVANFTATSDCFNAPIELVVLDAGGNPVGPVVSGVSSGTGAISFPGQTVVSGQVYRLTVRNSSSLATTHDYTIDTAAPVVSFTSPASNGAYSALGIPTTISVTGADGQSLSVVSTIGSTPQTIANLTVAAGVATDATTQYPNGAQTVTATVADLAGNSGTATINITVNNVACTLTRTNVVQAGSTAYINRSLAPGGVTNFTATTGCFNASVTLNLLDSGGNPINPGVTGTSSAAGAIAFNGQTVTDGQVYRVTVRNTGGLATSRDYTIDTVAPSVAYSTPTSTDGGPAVVVVTPAPATVTTAAADASPACAFFTPMAGVRTAAGCGTVASGAVSLPVAYPAEGVYTLEVEVTEASGNVGTASVTVLVQLTGCGMAFTRPATCPALLSSAQVSSGFYTFQTASKTTCSGVPVALSVQARLEDGGIGASASVGSGNIPVGGTTSIPTAVSTGAWLYTAVVNNIGTDAGTASAQCDVTVDLNGPAITSPIATPNPPYATINVAQDTQSGVPGAQRLLQYSALVPTGGHVDVCTTQATDPVSGNPRAATPECGAAYFLLRTGATSPDSSFTFPEGQYDLKIVVVALDGSTLASAPVSVLSDVTRPCVRAASRRLPQDLNTDARLNLAELGAAAPQLEFELDPACRDNSLSTLAASPVVIREIVGAAAPAGSYALPGDVTFASNKFTVNLTQGIVNEKDYTFWIQLTDLAGNTNLVQAVDPSNFPVRVDKVAPSCDISSPAVSTTLLGQSQVPGNLFGVTVATAADVSTNGVSIGLTGGAMPLTATATPSGAGNQASTSFAVSGTNAYTVSATCTDAAGNATPATARNLTIDLDSPTCAITAPTATTYAVNAIATALNVVGAEGRSVACTSNGTPLGSSFTVSSGVASSTLTYPNGTQTVACSLTDAANNPGSCSVANVVVNSTSCALTLSNAVLNANGEWFNRSNTGSLIGTGGVATINVNTPDCGAGKLVTLVRTSPAGVPASLSTSAGGDVAFSSVALVDGESWSVTIDNGAGLLTTKSFRVALVAPAAPGGATINSTAVASGSSLNFVASLRNRNVETAVAGYFGDLNAGTAGAQLDLAIAGITGARKFTLDGTLQVLFNGATVVSQSITNDPQTISLAGTTLPHNVNSALTVRILDAAGNQTDVLSNATRVDVLAPGEPNATKTVTNARTGQVTLQWNPTYDDGTDASSLANAGYDVRWTTSSVPGNGSLATPTLYFAATTSQDSASAWSASPITRVLNGLPPLNTYFISVRASDEVGNYSDFTPPASLPNLWTLTTLTNPAVSTDFGSTIAANGNVTGSALPDLVVAAMTRGGIGSVYVYAGANPFVSQATCGSGCQELTPPDGLGSSFGSDVSTDGNVGDDAADATTTGMADIVIGQRSFPGTGRAFVFFGSTGAITKSIEIRGDASNTAIGWTTRIVRDLDGDGLDEVALNAYLFGGGRGRVYIFKGRSFAAWQAAFVPATTYVAVTSADWVIEGQFPLIPASPVNGSNGLGLNRHGFGTLPGVTGGLRADGGVIPELVVPTSRANLSRTTIFSATSIVASSIASPLLNATGGVQTLTQTPTASTGLALGFGAAMWGRGPVVGGGVADLFVGYPSQGSVYYYTNWSASGAVGGTATGSVSGPSTFGSLLSAADLNADGRPDLLVSEGVAVGNGAWILWQKASMGPFDTPVGGANIRFQVSEFRPVLAPSASRFGANTALVDIDGVNGADVVLSDETAGIVRVYR